MLPSKWNSALFLMLTGCAAPCIWASPVTLFDNTAYTTGGNGEIATISPFGDSFSTGDLAFDFTDLSLVLLRQGSATGSSTFSLYSDNSEAPGTLITTLGTIQDSSLTTSPAEYTISGLNVALAPDTRYWILATGNGHAYWNSAPDASGTGTTNEFLDVNTLVLPDSEGPMNMAVSGDTVSATPEPGTVALMGAGLALALGWRFRPRRRTV